MKRLMFGILMAFGLVSVSFGLTNKWDLDNLEKGMQYVKEKVKYLEFLEKEVGLSPAYGEMALEEGRLYLEFAEKVKQSKKEECEDAVWEVYSENKDRYQYFLWSDYEWARKYGCMAGLSSFNDNLKKEEENNEYKKELYDAFIRQKANVMGSGNGAGLKDGVTEVGTLSDGTKIEIEKK